LCFDGPYFLQLKTKLAEGKFLHVTGIVRMSLKFHVRVPKGMMMMMMITTTTTIIIIIIINLLSRKPKTCNKNYVSKKMKYK
jgi:hypothetical protein